VGLVGCAGPVLVRLLGSTWRSTEIHREHIERVHESGRPVVLAFWHGALLPLTFIDRGRNIQVLTSMRPTDRRAPPRASSGACST